MTEQRPSRLSLLFLRALRLRCALCGKGKLFRNLFQMNKTCSHCGTVFEREPGFFLGSVYINYGVTSFIVAVGYPVLLFRRGLPNQTLLFVALAFILLFPLWFFRYSRSIWLAFDQYWDPRKGEQ